MKLLTALISTVGCPPELGAHWRPRTGCAPYIEFVVDFVLPRVIGSKNGSGRLFFATPADKARLLTRLLEVVEGVLFHYIVPPPIQRSNHSSVSNSSVESKLNVQGKKSTAQNEQVHDCLNLEDLLNYEHSMTEHAFTNRGLFVAKSLKSSSNRGTSMLDFNIKEVLQDFRNITIPLNSSSNVEKISSNEYQDQRGASSYETVPRAKTPGFFVLANMLSSNINSLSHILVRILLEDKNTSNIYTLHGKSVHSKLMAMSLFGEIKPSYAAAKAGKTYVLAKEKEMKLSSMPSDLVKSMVETLIPPSLQDTRDDRASGCMRLTTSSNDAVFWRERSILLTLRIMCLAACREEAFTRAVSSSPTALNIIPVLRFVPQFNGLVNKCVTSTTVRITRISSLLLDTVGFRAYLVPFLVQFVEYQCLALKEGEDIADCAMALISYLCASVSSHEYVRALCGPKANGQRNLAVAMSRRLLAETKHNGAPKKNNVKDAILNLILSNLSLNTVGDHNLSHIMLGLSGKSLNIQQHFLQTPKCERISKDFGQAYPNVMDAVLNLISNESFVFSPYTSALAMKCYEVVYRLCECSGDHSFATTKWLVRICTLIKLRQINFWERNLIRFLNQTDLTPSKLHMILAQSLLNENEVCSNLLFLSRDNDVVHCISWVLKGVTLELHILMGNELPATVPENLRFSSLVAEVAPQLSRCRSLLSLLFGNTSMLAVQVLRDLPVMKPVMEKSLGADNLPHEVIQSALKRMEGSTDIYGGYDVVDIEILANISHNISITNSQEISSTLLSWAEKWNIYVGFACSSSHLASSWSTMLQGALSCCQQMLVSGERDVRFGEIGLLTKTSLLELLFTLLSRLSIKGMNINSESQGMCKLESSCAISLSIASLSLVEFLLCYNTLLSNELQQTETLVEGEDLMQVADMILNAISYCDSREDDERTAILSCALTYVLDSKRLNGVLKSCISSTNIRLGKVVRHLSKLSRNIVSEDRSNKRYQMIASAARAALASLVCFLDLQTKEDKVVSLKENFLFLLLGVEQENHLEPYSHLSKLVELVSDFDTDVLFLLESIACCQSGADLLVTAGITDALLLAASKFEKSSGVSFVGTESYGSFYTEPPSFFHSHLSIMNALLTSPVHFMNQKLLNDAVQFIHIYSTIGESSVRNYPRNGEVTMRFISLLLLTSSGFEFSQNNGSGSGLHSSIDRTNSLRTGNLISFAFLRNQDTFNNLVQRVIDLAFHIAAHPFPSKYLPSLPNELVERQEQKISRSSHVSVNYCDGRSWWDRIPQSGANNDSCSNAVYLPDPPGVSDDSDFFIKNTNNINEQISEQRWTDEMYMHSISAARILELCLTFLIVQVNSSGRDLKLDSVSIGKALCRNTIAVQVSIRKQMALQTFINLV